MSDSELKIVSKYSDNSTEVEEHRRLSPPKIITNIVFSLPRGEGHPIAKNVVFIHPVLGPLPNNTLYLLYENQLEWLAEEWRKICQNSGMLLGDSEASSSLLLDSSNEMHIIRSNGDIYSIKVQPNDEEVEPE